MESIGPNAATFLLFVAIVASVFMWWSWFAAIRKSRGHPPFDEIIGQRRFVGYEAIPHMPPHVRPLIRRHFVALAFFVLTPIVLALFAG